MTQLFNEKNDIFVNNKIILGINDDNLPFKENESGDVLAFANQGNLYSYNITNFLRNYKVPKKQERIPTIPVFPPAPMVSVPRPG